MERKFLKTVIAGILLETGFHVAEPAVLETLVEMLFSCKFSFFSYLLNMEQTDLPPQTRILIFFKSICFLML